MKRGLDQTDRKKAFRISSIKTVDEIFEEADLQSRVFEKSGCDAFVVEPLTSLAGEVPLTHDEQNEKREYDEDRDDQNIDRPNPTKSLCCG